MNRLPVAAVVLAALVLVQPTANACTGIMLHNEDESVVHGRTLEFGIYVDTNIVVIPRGYGFTGDTPDGDGLKYKAKYAAVGVMTFTDVKVLDGLNEEGLALGAFYFPTFAEYTPVTDTNRKKGLSPNDFPNWILTQFATVAEVRQAVEAGTVVVTPTVIEGWGPVAPPFQWMVYDKTGACISINPLGGELVVYDNPLGVMTNSPSYDWHMTNLRNYIALDPRNVPPVEVRGTSFGQLGQGSGMLGLPGDFTPPSRFVRAAVFSATAIPEKNAERGILQIFHILNNFDIPVGVAREEHGDQLVTDYTMLTIARDPQSLRYYYRTYEDQTIRFVDLSRFDLQAKKIRKLSTRSAQPTVDMTDKVE